MKKKENESWVEYHKRRDRLDDIKSIVAGIFTYASIGLFFYIAAHFIIKWW